MSKWEDRFQKKNVIDVEKGVRWLISVIVKKMRIRDNGKKE